MNIAMISATYTRWAVRIILFFSWIYKKSVMTVFNNQTKFIHPSPPLHVATTRSCETASGAKKQEAYFGRSY